MTTHTLPDQSPTAADGAPVVDVVVPVRNEAHVLAASIERLVAYLTDRLPFPWVVTIVDNGSDDATLAEADRLAAAHHGAVRVRHLDQRGRGLALHMAWSSSEAAVLAYMDVDLSTGLDALLPLVAPLVSGHSDLAIGSRLAPGASVARGPKREVISRGYNALLHLVFSNRFRDAQCGFKAIRRDVAHHLLPLVEDRAWFFDTELLLLAERNGLRIHEVPVDWVDDVDSRVDLPSTIKGDLRGVWRMAKLFVRGGGRVELGGAARPPLADDFGRQTVGFALVGLASTLVSLALYLVLRGSAGPPAANAIAVSATALANTGANRRWTFARRGRDRRLRQYLGAVLVTAAGLAVSSLALVVVHRSRLGLAAELATLVVTWGLTTLARFVVLRQLVFRPDRPVRRNSTQETR